MVRPPWSSASTVRRSRATATAGSPARLRLPKVEKWWPHTHGTPTLHDVKLRTAAGEIDLGRIGFRSIAVDRDSDGKGFALVVNGVKIFARGACWSAADLVSLAGDRARLAPWLTLARDAHMNMIRVGGTMTYESDDFFALCDELGLLVWHDFMFANMDYPIADPVVPRQRRAPRPRSSCSRTRHHPSLAVLCGGSEVAQQVAMMGLPPALWTGPLYEEILPAAVARLRPDVPYVPHSPGGGDLPFSTAYRHLALLRRRRLPAAAGRRAPRQRALHLRVPGLRQRARRGQSRRAVERSGKWKAAIPRDRGADWDFEDVTNHYVRLLYGPGRQASTPRAPRRAR